jgi:Arc/MetJ-type ribon-helix-helix transcriptional regulator
MPLLLTPEQEQRIQAVVSTGAFSSTEDALNAAVIAVEAAASPNFEGNPEELEGLLMDGLVSQELTEDQFWDSVDRETNALAAGHNRGQRA